jgi:hypothetical protein
MPKNCSAQEKLFETAQAEDDPRSLILAATRIIEHAGQVLQEKGSEPIPAARAILQIVRDWLRDGCEEMSQFEEFEAPIISFASADESTPEAWSHYLSCCHLAHMLREHIEQDFTRPAQRLCWAALEARNAIAYVLAGRSLASAEHDICWNEEAVWQLACLEETLSPRVADGTRLRNSLLASRADA